MFLAGVGTVATNCIRGRICRLQPEVIKAQKRSGDSTIRFDKFVSRRVSLETMKADAQLKDLKLIRQSRLSVVPATEKQAERILELAGAK